MKENKWQPSLMLRCLSIALSMYFSGLVFLLAVYTLSIPQLGTEDIGKGLEWIFMILLPNFDLGSALQDMYTNAGFQDTCESYNYEFVCARLPSNASFGCCFPSKYQF